MIKKSLMVCALCAPLLLSGCVVSVGGDGDGYYHQSDWQKRESNNRRHISKLDTSMTLEMVSSRMGMADFDESYQRDGSSFRVLYYRTQRSSDDGVTTKDECTPLVFKDGVLMGWGDAAIREYL